MTVSAMSNLHIPSATELAATPTAKLYAVLHTQVQGLTSAEAAARLQQFGPNILTVSLVIGFGL
jgi:hypothetical protein